MTHATSEEPIKPSSQVLNQRVRNRVIEYLELASSFTDQREYEMAAPIAHIPYEVIEQWEDWVPVDPRNDLDDTGAYDSAELQAMGEFHATWDEVASAIPDNYPTLSEVQALPEWGRLRDAAASALSVFMRRGKMPEDHEAEI